MTKFRVLGDLHLDYNYDLYGLIYTMPKNTLDDDFIKELSIISSEILPPLEDDENTYLMIPGDVHSKMRDVTYAELLFGKRFKHVYIVLGNHSYFYTYFNDNIPENSENVTVLEKDVVDIDGLKVAGCSLWTDMNKCDPLDLILAKGYMNDYHQIKLDKGINIPLNPITTAKKSQEHAKWLESLEGIDIVMTHHLPSYQCVSLKYKNNLGNFCFASNYDYIIDKLQPKIWLYGHSHTPMDFIHSNNKTRMINMPMGYTGEVKNINKTFILNVKK